MQENNRTITEINQVGGYDFFKWGTETGNESEISKEFEVLNNEFIYDNNYIYDIS